MTKIYFSKTNFHGQTAPPEIKKMQSEYCRQIVSEAVCKEFELKSDEIIFSADPNGKPFLADFPGIHFNISHTTAAVAAAISNKPIGIDIELIKSDSDTKTLKIAKKMFLPHEVEYITERQNETGKRFCEIWTRKEAYAKYLGTGIFVKNIMRFDVLNQSPDVEIDTLFVDRWVVSVCGEAVCNAEFVMLSI